MCGLAGIFAHHPDAPPPDLAELDRITSAMASRGPDGAGAWQDPGARIALGHRRLAIIDLSDAAAQPMLSADCRLALAYNGEIFNHRALRQELEAAGRSFRTTSDSEVLLALWEAHGPDMLGRLRGMYAFALWDARDQSLFLARDPFGLKPLYLADDGRTLRFASQVKALLAGGGLASAPDLAGWAGFHLLGHVPEPFTLHQGIRALPAGTALRIGRDGARRTFRHFDLRAELQAAEASPLDLAPEAAQARLREALASSVRAHLESDVPVGVFLSAGLDSSTLVALAAEAADAGPGRLQALTLGFREFEGTAQDETALAAVAARHAGVDHTVRWISKADFEAHLDRALAAMDQPSIDGLNTYFVSLAARAAGLKVALSGLGGDELLGGYPSFRQVPRMARALGPLAPLARAGLGRLSRRLLSPLLPARLSPKWAGLLEYGGTLPGAYLLRRALRMPWELAPLLGARDAERALEELDLPGRLAAAVEGLRTPRLQVMALELQAYMGGQLLKDSDWAGMAHGVEIRVPMVDPVLFRALAPIQAGPRPLHKRDLAACPRKGLPQAIVDRPKTGFGTPIAAWAQAPGPTRGERGLRGWSQRVARAQGFKPTRRILVFRIGSLGDTLVALPSFHLIARAFPDAERLVLTHAPLPGKATTLRAVLEGSDLVQGYLEYDAGRPRWIEGLRLRRRIRELEVETLVYLAPVRSEAQRRRDRLFFRLCGLRHLIGMEASRSDPPKEGRRPSEASRLMASLSALGRLDLEDPSAWDLRPSAEERAAAARALLPLPPERPVLAVSLGTKQPANDWGEANWTSLLASLGTELQGWSLFLIGAAEERDSSQRAAAGWPGPVLNACGELPPRVAGAALARAALFLGHDSGPLHLAASVGVRCVGIFGARNPPGLWFPHGQGHEILYHAVPCAGCGLSVCPPFREHRCMTSITVEEVREVVRQMCPPGPSEEIPSIPQDPNGSCL